jgi:hypothetical protein
MESLGVTDKIRDIDHWIESIVTVRFDLEEGQVLDYQCPPNFLSEAQQKFISYNSFPDSFTFNHEGDMTYSFILTSSNFFQ